MKNTLATLFLLSLAIFAQAQSSTFKPFKVDIATGYALPGGMGAKGGILLAVEPKYALNDNLTLGFRWEGALMGRAHRDSSGDLKSADLKGSSSYLATADYYFTTSRFRPFAGAGLGLYQVAAASIDVDGTTADGGMGAKIGIMPRAGFEAGHFRMAVEYNLVGKSRSVSNSYLGIKMGLFIGGGKIRESEYAY